MYRNCMRAIVALLILAIAAPISPAFTEEIEPPPAPLVCESGLVEIKGECVEAESDNDPVPATEGGTDDQTEEPDASSEEGDPEAGDESNDPDAGDESNDPDTGDETNDPENTSSDQSEADDSTGDAKNDPETEATGSGGDETKSEDLDQEKPDQEHVVSDDNSEADDESSTDISAESSDTESMDTDEEGRDESPELSPSEESEVTDEMVVMQADYSRWLCVPNFGTNPTTYTLTEFTDSLFAWEAIKGGAQDAEADTDCSSHISFFVTHSCEDKTATVGWDVRSYNRFFLAVGAPIEGVWERLHWDYVSSSGRIVVTFADSSGKLDVEGYAISPEDGAPNQFYLHAYSYDCDNEPSTEYSQWICVPKITDTGTTYDRVHLTHPADGGLYLDEVHVDEDTDCSDLMASTFTLNCPDMSFQLSWVAGFEGLLLARVDADGEVGEIFMTFTPSGPAGTETTDLPYRAGVVSFWAGRNAPSEGHPQFYYFASYP